MVLMVVMAVVMATVMMVVMVRGGTKVRLPSSVTPLEEGWVSQWVGGQMSR